MSSWKSVRSHVKEHLLGKGGWALWNWNGDHGRLRQLEASKVPGHPVLRTTPIGPFTVAGSVRSESYCLGAAWVFQC